MRPFFDDYDELAESSFDNFAATRRLLSEKQHQHQHHLHEKRASRKRRGHAHPERWAGDDEYYELRFDD